MQYKKQEKIIIDNGNVRDFIVQLWPYLGLLVSFLSLTLIIQS